MSSTFKSQLAAAKGQPVPAVPPTSVEIVTPTVEIKTVTFLNGSAVEAYTTDQLVEIVRKLETRKAELVAIKAKSEKISNMIHQIDDDIKQVVAFIDEHN